jgi:trehalose-6-phosphatase
MLHPLIRDLDHHAGIRVFEGPAVAEIQFFPSANKSFGIRRLCRILKFDPSGGRIFYAGDDENDAMAMRWVISKKGAAVVVGGRIRLPGVRCVDGPSGLVRAVRGMVRPPGRGGMSVSR